MARRRRGRSSEAVRRSMAGRGLLALSAIAVLLAGGLWFAPRILLNSSWKDRYLSQWMEPLELTVASRRISASWFSPLVVYGLEVRQADGSLLLEAESARSSKTLWHLLTAAPDSGRLTLVRPVAHVALRGEGSNLEDLVARYQLLPPSGGQRTWELAVTEGAVVVTDAARGSTWMLQQLEGSCRIPSGGGEPVQGQCSASALAQGESPGKLEADWRCKVAAEGAPGSGHVRLQAEGLPLHIGESLLCRWRPDVQVRGRMSGVVHLEWNGDSQEWRAEPLSIHDLQLTAPSLLYADQLRNRSLEVGGAVILAADRWTLRGVTLRTDAGQVELDGEGPWGQGGAHAARMDRLMQSVSGARLMASGRIDLAHLSRMLPRTLRLRQDVQVTAGQLQFELRSETAAQEQTVTGRLLLRQLAGMHGQRPIQLEEPLELEGDLRRRDDRWIVNHLRGSASFLSFTAQGSAAAGSIAVRGDLGDFLADAGRFVEWGPQEMAGAVSGQATWQRQGDGRINLNAEAQARRFLWRTPGRPAWREDMLELSLAAIGRADHQALHHLDEAQFELVSASDRCRLALTESLAQPGRHSSWPLSLSVEGHLQTWLPRLVWLRSRDSSGFEGAISLNARGQFGPRELVIDSSKLQVRQLVAPVGQLVVREPVVEVEARGRWDGRVTWELPEFSVASSSLAFRAENIVFSSAPAVRFSGVVGYRADLERLANWAQRQRQRVSGQMVGRIQLDTQGSVSLADISADLTDFQVQRSKAHEASDAAARVATVSHRSRWETMWAEPKLKLAAKGRWDAAQDRVVLEHAELAGDTLSIGAKGAVEAARGRALLSLEGEVAYDLQRLGQRLSGSAASVQLVGRSTAPFSLRGPLRGERATSSPAGSMLIDQWLASSRLKWDSGTVGGFALGPGVVQPTLKGGVVSIEPLELGVSEGTLRLAPRIDLRAEQPMLMHAEGKVAEQVRISPAMCESWLKYVAPLLASATSADGRFSMTLDSMALPVTDPFAGAAQGKLEVHGAQVGPGPLSRQFLWLAEQVKAVLERKPLSPSIQSGGKWITLPPQQVAFRLIDGRIEHQTLEMVAQDVVVRTRGSVDGQQRLALVAEVPIRDQWVENDRWLQSLRGQTLQIPVGGTLSDPKLDTRVLDQIARQLVTGAASRVLEQELNRGLDLLLRPRP